MTKIIAVVGTPHSGKTVFINTLYKQLIGKTSFMVHTACPDGEGRWCSDSDPNVVQKIRTKGKFDKDFVDYQVNAIKTLRKNGFSFVLVDMGGLPTPENKAILEHCDYYIFLQRPDKEELISEWKKLLNSLNIKPIAILKSVWEGKASYNINDIFYAELVKLDRGGVPDTTVEVIKKFGEFIIERFGGVSMNEKFVIEVNEHPEWVFVDVKIGGNGLITPDELCSLLSTVEETVGKRYYRKGIIISGRLPIWAHSALAHLFHGSKWVAHFDPRLGAVIAQTHDPEVKEGTVIPLDKIL